MRVLRFASVLAIVAGVFGTSAAAYTLDQAAKPREYPPASYTGDVYVDSRGCIYVRANIGTAVNWVPRLAADRKTVICNATPGAATRSAGAVPPPPPPPPAPVMTTTAPDAPAPVTTAAAPTGPLPTPAPRPMASTEPARPAVTRTLTVTCPADGQAARVRIGSSTVAVQCDPAGGGARSYLVRHANGDTTRLVANPAPRPAQAVTLAARSAPTAAPQSDRAAVLAEAGIRAVADRPLVSTSPRVRIGNVPPGGATNNFGRTYGVLQGGTTGGSVTAGPGGVAGYAAPVVNPQRVIIPTGYRSAWRDDRLNPNRGPRTATGNAQMAALYEVEKLPMRERVETVQAGGTLVYAAKNAGPAAVSATVANGHRYVQVGAFRNAGNAARAADRLSGLGLNGRVIATGSGLNLVVAGPYADAGALSQALSTARRGFPDAILRR